MWSSEHTAAQSGLHRAAQSVGLPAGTARFRRLGACAGLALVVSVGCQSPPRHVPLDPIPLRAAAEIVNDNAAAVAGVLRAAGSVDGYATFEDGRRQSYHLDAILFFLAPSFVRFDLKAFGERQLLFGSNIEQYWYYDKQADVYHCGHHGEGGPLTAQLPAPPEQLIEVLGLRSVPLDGVIQRVEDEYQQILVFSRRQAGPAGDRGDLAVIEKEYWLDRYAPRLMRRLLFRDQDGLVTMASRFDDYRRLAPDGPWLPHRITVTWPPVAASMSFHIAKWRVVPGLDAGSIQFALPANCIPQ